MEVAPGTPGRRPPNESFRTPVGQTTARELRSLTSVQRSSRGAASRARATPRTPRDRPLPIRSPRLQPPRPTTVHAERLPPRIPEPSVLFKMDGAHRPERWGFIFLVPHEQFASVPKDELISKQAAFAYCTECSCKVAYSHGATTAVKVHMEKYHMEVLLHAKQTQLEERGRSAKRQLENAYDHAPESSKKQLTEVSNAVQAYVNGLLAKWVAQSMRSLSILEYPWLLEFIRFITQELAGVFLDVPGATQIRADIVRVAAELRASLKSWIRSSCQFFCITTDIWTSKRAQRYMSFTLHYVEEDFTLCSWVLEVEGFPGMHTGGAIANGLGDMMERWELKAEVCTLLVRDGDSNAVLAAEFMGVNNMSCISHTLHLVLGAALARQKEDAAVVDAAATDSEVPIANRTPESAVHPVTHSVIHSTGHLEQEDEVAQDPEAEQQAAVNAVERFVTTSLSSRDTTAKSALGQMRDIAQRFRSLATYFHKSPKATNRLDQIQVKDWKRSSLHLITDCPTRWNSRRDMLARLIELHAPLDDFFSRLERPEFKDEFRDLSRDKLPKPREWFAIRCLLAVLDPIAAVTKVLSGDFLSDFGTGIPYATQDQSGTGRLRHLLEASRIGRKPGVPA